MFNKYRGQNQIKNQNSPSDRHERIEKKQPEPAAVEKEVPEKAKKPVFPSSREKKPAPVATARPGADNDLLRQQEEDEWFRKFKGEAEPVINEEPAPEEPLFDDVPDAENDLPSDDGHDEEIAPEAEIEEEILPEEDASYQKESEPEETEEEPEEESEEEPEETPETSEESYSEEVSALEEELAEVEAEAGSVSPQGVLEEAIPVKMFEDLEREEEVAEEEPALSPEEDDEKWIQDPDIQEKTGTVPEEEESPVPAAAVTEYEGAEAGDESDWYQSTPLIRTAALIVLDLTEEDEEYVEETDEDKEAYQSDGVAGEEWPEEPDTDEVLTSIDEVIEDMPEEEVEEVTIDEVDEKLASLMEEEPKEEIDMDAVLDNMDRIIQQTEATPVQFVEETAPAPAPKPRPNPNRNRKKKKKKR